ncbi:hypothetical protein ACLKA7_011862 [Drosophila subpalustris]
MGRPFWAIVGERVHETCNYEINDFQVAQKQRRHRPIGRVQQQQQQLVDEAQQKEEEERRQLWSEQQQLEWNLPQVRKE